jgi:excisionase family DNA binding protein
VKKYLTVTEVTELLPVSKSLVYLLVDDGTIASTRGEPARRNHSLHFLTVLTFLAPAGIIRCTRR